MAKPPWLEGCSKIRRLAARSFQSKELLLDAAVVLECALSRPDIPKPPIEAHFLFEGSLWASVAISTV